MGRKSSMHARAPGDAGALCMGRLCTEALACRGNGRLSKSTWGQCGLHASPARLQGITRHAKLLHNEEKDTLKRCTTTLSRRANTGDIQPLAHSAGAHRTARTLYSCRTRFPASPDRNFDATTTRPTLATRCQLSLRARGLETPHDALRRRARHVLFSCALCPSTQRPAKGAGSASPADMPPRCSSSWTWVRDRTTPCITGP